MNPSLEDSDSIRTSVRERFARIAETPEQERKFPVGPESAKSVGYRARAIDDLPREVTESFCGVGNPLGLGDLRTGQTVLDLGSGAGLDAILAARRVGAGGRVIGVDMTEDMIRKAQRNATSLGLTNAEFRLADLERLPVDDDTVDVAITNGVFNLCPDKPRVLAEVFRVLRPAGRLQMADILLDENVTPDEVAEKGTWSD
jgi:SAM-dependent methyltransferase